MVYQGYVKGVLNLYIPLFPTFQLTGVGQGCVKGVLALPFTCGSRSCQRCVKPLYTFIPYLSLVGQGRVKGVLNPYMPLSPTFHLWVKVASNVC